MLAALAPIAAQYALPYWASLEAGMACGFGAKSAANSTLPVPMRSRLAFSHVQPPCIAVLTITQLLDHWETAGKVEKEMVEATRRFLAQTGSQGG